MKNRLCASASCWATSTRSASPAEDLLDLGGQPLEAGDEPLAVGDRQVAHPAELEREQREAEEHVGQRLGAGDGDLGAGVEVDAAVALARDRRAHDVDQADAAPALAAYLLHGEQGVDGLAGLADRDVEGVGLDDRVAVAELARRLGVGGDAGQLLDQRRTHLADVVGRAAAEDLHAAHRAEVAGVHVEAAEVRGAEPLVEPAAQHGLRGRRLLEDLLAHERLVLACFVRRRVDVDDARGLAGGGEVAVAHRGEAGRRHGGHLAVVEHRHGGGVAHDRGEVGGDVHLLVTDADHERAAVAGHDDAVGEVGVEDGEAVGPDDRAERVAHLALEGVGVAARDQVGDHLGVGVAGEHHAGVGELGAQGGRVVDDPVVHDGDAAGLVEVRVGVGIGGGTVGGPPGVADARRAGEALGQRRPRGHARGRPAWPP